MRLLSASALWWLLLSAIIIFFYLLKLKRKRRIVPSVFLWQRALEEVEANAPFKKLRRSLLLLLQLLALFALVFALTRPLVTMRALASGSTIIVIDATASMSARDEDGRSRLDRAKELARDMVNGLSGDDRAAIIESNSRVTVRSSLTSDRAALASAIGEVRETDAAGNLTDAVRLAEQIAKTERESGIVIISDGGGAPIGSDLGSSANSNSSADSSQGVPIRFVRVGRRADNAGIVAMNSRPAPVSGGRELFASVANFSDSERTMGIELKLDGKLVDAQTVSVAANDRNAIIFDAMPPAGGLAELKLTADDDLASDDLAYTFLPDARRTRVGVISDNPFLIQALAVNPDFDARRVGAGAGAALSDFDCIISEGTLRDDVIDSNRPMLVINPSDVAGLWRATAARERPEVTSVERSHPINSYLSYADLHVESATRREAAAWLKPIVSSSDDGLIWAGDDGRRRVVMIGFDLAQSDLPLKVEFPILLSNSMAWLAGRDALATDRAVRAGQPATIRTSAASITVTTPAGDTEELAARDGSVIFADTLRAGAYELKDAPPFAASLLSEAESDTAPRDSIKTRTGEVSGQASSFYSEREFWRWIALAALTVLTIEWWVYHRRIT
jgi:von Willebrand factor type A domain/Aerotolerance regulator N-terminal